MELQTPTNSNHKRNRRRSSLSASLGKSRKSIDPTAPKIVKQILIKDKLRKQNQYKKAKANRAKLYEEKRHISEQGKEDVDRLEEDVYDSEQSMQEEEESWNNQESTQIQNLSVSLLTTEQINQIEEQEVQIEQKSSISSKLTSNLAKHFNTIKETVVSKCKNIISHQKVENKENKYKTQVEKFQAKHNQIRIPDIIPPKPPVSKVRRSISMTHFSSNSLGPSLSKLKPVQQNVIQGVRNLRKQESTSSCVDNPIGYSTLLSASKSSNCSSTSMRSSSSYHSQLGSNPKPAFKPAYKVKYDDSYLYRSVNIYLKCVKKDYKKFLKAG